MVAIGLHLLLGRAFSGGDLASIMSGVGAIPVLLMVLLALFLRATRITDITWGFSLAKNGPHDINVGGVKQLVPFLEKSLDVVL